jgi:cellobiose phosphorylase
VLTQMFGFKGEYGELVIKPKLVKEQFGSDGKVKTCAFFLGKRIELTYINQYNMDYDEYKIINIRLNNNDVNFLRVDEKTAKIEKSVLKLMLKEKEINHVEVDLG